MKFYGQFAAAYGTIWLVLLALSLLTQSHIDTGAFGLFGFPAIALGYAAIRTAGETSRTETDHLRERVAELEAVVSAYSRDRSGPRE